MPPTHDAINVWYSLLKINIKRGENLPFNTLLSTSTHKYMEASNKCMATVTVISCPDLHKVNPLVLRNKLLVVCATVPSRYID